MPKPRFISSRIAKPRKANMLRKRKLRLNDSIFVTYSILPYFMHLFFEVFVVFWRGIYYKIKMSDNFLEEEIFFESDPEPNFELIEKSVPNDSQVGDA